MLILGITSVLAGIAMLWVFRVTSNQDAIGRTKRHLQACLYELRLFPDEPLLVWRAQRGLLAANARYIALMLVPAIVLSVPMALLFGQLDCLYGMRPLDPGRSALVTMQMKQPLDASAPMPVLEAPAGIAVETQAVRIVGERQVSWRIRASRDVSGVLRVVLPRETVEKTIVAGSGARYVSVRRVSSVPELLWHPGEKPLSSPAVDWIEVAYSPAKVLWLGLDFHWLIWLLLFSSASALLLKRRFRVSF
jgi:hypothetical protein